MPRPLRTLVLVFGLLAGGSLLASGLLACGGGSPRASESAPPNTVEEETPAGGGAFSIVGHWHGEMSGGPVASTVDWYFEEDGTYAMEGYPSIGENGRFAVTEGDGDSFTLSLLNRLSCGPCEDTGPIEPQEDEDRPTVVHSDGSLSLAGWTLTRQAAPPASEPD